MAYSSFSLLGTFLLLFLFLSHHQAQAQDAAPAPSSGPLNLTAILVKAGQFNVFCRLLVDTQVDKQIDNQLNNSAEGMTLFAPTDGAFDRLEAGTLNGLSNQKQVNLILNHFLPKYYTQDNLLTVSNPVRTQFSDGGLNFTGQSHQVNVSSGVVNTQVNNAIRAEFPLAIYAVNEVLIAPALLAADPPASAPPPAKSTPADKDTTKAAVPSAEDSTGGSTRSNVGLGSVLGLVGLAISLS